MKIEYWNIGKTREIYVQEGMAYYIKNIKRYCSLETKILSAASGKHTHSIESYKAFEAQQVLKRLIKSDFLVILDETGRTYTSVDFAGWLRRTIDQSPRRLIFLTGGAYGFSNQIYERAQFKLSLSLMTFPHQLIRILFLEQLYRGFTIINNQSYHH